MGSTCFTVSDYECMVHSFTVASSRGPNTATQQSDQPLQRTNMVQIKGDQISDNLCNNQRQTMCQSDQQFRISRNHKEQTWFTKVTTLAKARLQERLEHTRVRSMSSQGHCSRCTCAKPCLKLLLLHTHFETRRYVLKLLLLLCAACTGRLFEKTTSARRAVLQRRYPTRPRKQSYGKLFRTTAVGGCTKHLCSDGVAMTV